MLKKLMMCLVLMLGSAVFPAVSEDESKTPVDEFLNKSRGGTMLCAWSWFPRGEKWSQREKLEPKIDACQTEQLDLVEPSFGKALDSVKNKQAAVESLKSYYAAWISLMSGMTLHPFVRESREAYTDRQMAIDDRLEKMAIRVRIDARY